MNVQLHGVCSSTLNSSCVPSPQFPLSWELQATARQGGDVNTAGKRMSSGWLGRTPENDTRVDLSSSNRKLVYLQGCSVPAWCY